MIVGLTLGSPYQHIESQKPHRCIEFSFFPKKFGFGPKRDQIPLLILSLLIFHIPDSNPSMPDVYDFDRPFIHTSRSTFTQAEFEEDHPRKPREKASCSTRIRKQCQCSALCLGQSLLRKFPFVRMLRGYKPREWLLSDLIAGISIAVVHIPQGTHVLSHLTFIILTFVSTCT